MNNIRQAKIRFKRWPVIVTGLLALVPVLVLLAIATDLYADSLPAINGLGFAELFSTNVSSLQVSTGVKYGLVPALWGTLTIVIVAILIALPVSLSMAICVREYGESPAGRFLKIVLGFFTGIPPVVYAIASILILQAFIRPKLCGLGMPAELTPLPGTPFLNLETLPLGDCSFTAGLILSLLVIPFMAPLFIDALQNVPGYLTEASLGLGASRWYTLWKVIIPNAMTGIIAGTVLGALKATGDVIISAWIVYFNSSMPSPIFDIFERNAPLTAMNAGMLGMAGGEVARGFGRSVASFAGLLLLIFATLLLIAAEILKKVVVRRSA